MRLISVVLLGALFITNQVNAQLKLTYELRPRGEYRYGYKQLPDSTRKPSVVVSQRTRLSLYNSTEKINFGVSVQDVRVWGDEQLMSSTGLYGDAACLDLHEAWVQLPVTKKLSFKAGRQELKYDDERIISRRNWNQNGLSYDALLVQYKNNFNIDVGLSLNNEAENTFAEEYPQNKFKTLDYIHVSKTLKEKMDVSVLLLASGYQKENSSDRIYFRGTYGSHLSYENTDTYAAVSGYYQNGQNKTGKAVSAYLFSADFNQNIGNLNAGVGIVYISGQDSTNNNADYTNKDHSFDLMYGSRHRYYGYMDYYSNMTKGTYNAGLTDIYMNLKYKIHPSHHIETHLHYFKLNGKVFEDAASTDHTIDKYLGSEIDLVYKWKIIKEVNLEFGICVILPDESLEFIQNVSESELAYFGYLMLKVNQDILFNRDK